jgi:hypothetical protein
MKNEKMFISKSKSMMNPFQAAVATIQADQIAETISKSATIDIFSISYAMLEVGASLIIEMQNDGQQEEVNALLEDFVKLVKHNEIAVELIPLDEKEDP